MCGIAGFWNHNKDDPEERMRAIGMAMTDRLIARGPDSGGLWTDPCNGLVLGHRRLAIRDLTPTGHQPMHTPGGRHVICYNGEIYNAEELRDELADAHGIRFRGASDTEVVLHGCAQWGVEHLLNRLIGMFAFAFWDATRRCLTLARDRLGIKPLYYLHHDKRFLFASELKSLCAHDCWTRRISRPALAEMLTYGYIMAPRSIYEEVCKLEPGCLIEVRDSGNIAVKRFWNAREIMLAGQNSLLPGSDAELVEQTESLIRDAVKRRMRADVPLGAFLSGGIDSSLVVALMQAQSATPINTFSIGFDEQSYNEAPFAKAVAECLGTNHVEQYMQPSEAWQLIPRLPEIYDEPFSDSSQLPTLLLSILARKHVVMALSGDGGDELFAGYGRYFLYGADHSALPAFLAGVFRRSVHATPEHWLEQASRLVPRRYRENFPRRLRAYADRMAVVPMKRYKQQMALWENTSALLPGAELPFCGMDDLRFLNKIRDYIGQMQAADTLCYLPDDILVKVDRASMAVSLETRVPLLDHRLFAHAWRLPMRMKVRNGRGKWILRAILNKYIPNHLVERPKMGFGVPIDVWLRDPLREWASDMLNPARLRREGLIAPDIATSVWKRHLDGENWCYPLWSVLMFQAWHEYWNEQRN